MANSNSHTVSAYRINPATGALIAVGGGPVATGLSPRSVSVDPSGQFAYVANFVSSTVATYRIDSTTGALIAMDGGSVAAGANPVSVVTTATIQ